MLFSFVLPFSIIKVSAKTSLNAIIYLARTFKLKWIARSAIMQGSCVSNEPKHRVSREASVCSGIYARDERHAMILVSQIGV